MVLGKLKRLMKQGDHSPLPPKQFEIVTIVDNTSKEEFQGVILVYTPSIIKIRQTSSGTSPGMRSSARVLTFYAEQVHFKEPSKELRESL